MWPSTGAAVSVVSKLVNVEAMKSISQASELSSESDRSITLLLEVDSSSHGAVTLEHANCLDHRDVSIVGREV